MFSFLFFLFFLILPFLLFPLLVISHSLFRSQSYIDCSIFVIYPFFSNFPICVIISFIFLFLFLLSFFPFLAMPFYWKSYRNGEGDPLPACVLSFGVCPGAIRTGRRACHNFPLFFGGRRWLYSLVQRRPAPSLACSFGCWGVGLLRRCGSACRPQRMFRPHD